MLVACHWNLPQGSPMSHPQLLYLIHQSQARPCLVRLDRRTFRYLGHTSGASRILTPWQALHVAPLGLQCFGRSPHVSVSAAGSSAVLLSSSEISRSVLSTRPSAFPSCVAPGAGCSLAADVVAADSLGSLWQVLPRHLKGGMHSDMALSWHAAPSGLQCSGGSLHFTEPESELLAGSVNKSLLLLTGPTREQRTTRSPREQIGPRVRGMDVSARR